MPRGRSTSGAAARVGTGTAFFLLSSWSNTASRVVHHDLRRMRVGHGLAQPDERERSRRRQDPDDVVERGTHRRRVRVAVVGVHLARALDDRRRARPAARGAEIPCSVRMDKRAERRLGDERHRTGHGLDQHQTRARTGRRDRRAGRAVPCSGDA